MVEYVLVSAATQVAGALVFALLLSHFASRGGRSYLHLWLWSWLMFVAYVTLATAARLSNLFWAPDAVGRTALSIASQGAAFAHLVLLLGGTFELSARRPGHRRWIAPALFGAFVLGTVLTLLWMDDPSQGRLRYFARVEVRGIATALVFGAAGIFFGVRHWGVSKLGSRMFATAMVLYGGSQLATTRIGLPLGPDAVTNANHLAFVHLDLLLQLAICLGMLIWLLETESEERQRDWQRLVSSEERYRTVTESASDAILTIDESSTVRFANEGAARMFGYSVSELVGGSLTMLMPDSARDRHLSRLQEHIDSGRRHFAWAGVRLTGRHKDGREVPFEMSLSRYTGDGGRKYFTGILRDMSDRIQIEAQRRRSQRLEAIGQLAGGISHDFNNLLMAIGGNTDLALNTLSAEHPSYRRIMDVRRITGRASDLTRKLLAFSRQRPVELEVTDLNAAVEDFCVLLRRLIGEQVTLDISLCQELLLVEADPSLIDQVLLNLAINARDAMPQGGVLGISTTAVTITAEADQQSPARRAGSFVCLRVTDTGTGIPPQHLDRIFDPFFTTKDVGHGTGLGLATAYGVTKQHGGWIEVESEVGGGSSFAVFLERVWAQPQASPPEPAAAVAGTERVLVVEDETDIRAVIAEALTAAGYDVLCAADGPAALSAANDAGWAIDAVIADIVMPGGMNGFEVAARLREMRPAIKVIFISGYHEQTVPIGAPAHAYVSKPVGLMDLLRTLRRTLDAPA